MSDPEYKPTQFEMQQLIEQSLNGGKVPAAKTKKPEEVIKETCGLLHSFGFEMVHAEFDGSGDSGDFDVFRLLPKRTPKYDSPHHEQLRLENEEHSISFGTFKRETIDGARTSEQLEQLTEKLNAFEAAVWEILPCGWENNEGSFGEVDIDLINSTIHMVVNERISDVNTYERDF